MLFLNVFFYVFMFLCVVINASKNDSKYASSQV
jgi:hypothetical protein